MNAKMNDFVRKHLCVNSSASGCRELYWAFDSVSKHWIAYGCNCKEENFPSCVAFRCSQFMASTSSGPFHLASTDELSTVPTKCVGNAIHNLEYYAHKGIYLKLVGGIFGCKIPIVDGIEGPQDAVYLVYGGLALFDVDTSMKKLSTGGGSDFYFWLEDNESRVYDVIPMSTLVSAKILGVVLKDVKPLHVFEGISKHDLFENHGLWYREVEWVAAAMERYMKKKLQRKVSRQRAEEDQLRRYVEMFDCMERID